MIPRDDATERQVQAADPGASTWLSANAGSGKTRVLTDRVARLLLRGVPPQRILCLTYTKAAASEMQNRLFARLGGWAMLDDEALKDALGRLGVDQRADGETLRRARRLFASAIETPGGLKIQTIHAFCAGLLRRFPLEAGLSPGFTEIDERTMTLLRDDVIEDLADRFPETLDALGSYPLGESFDKLAAEIVRNREALANPPDDAALRTIFGLSVQDDEARLLADVFLGSERALIEAVLPVLDAGLVTDRKAAAKLRQVSADRWSVADLTLLEGIFLFGKTAGVPFGAKTGRFPTKDTRIALGDALGGLEALMLRVEAARARRIALAAYAKTRALHDFARVFLPAYEGRKARMGWLDFDDLIIGARRLLSDPSVAQWVLYKLDGGVDHILVDEAQDTSPGQWRVVELLTQEFTAGLGADTGERTIFVVGDKKQSIYSFQGADLAAFDRMRAHFSARLGDMGVPLVDSRLEHSFRSSAAILRLVDETFDEARGHGLGGAVNHIAFKGAMPGRVDLWPPIERAEKPAERDWFDPVDIVTDEHHDARLARRIATEIARMLAEGTAIPVADGARRVRAGDFLILVQRRSALFYHLIRACKAAGLPIAGADRMNLAAELAVKDLSSLLAFLDLPEDDLALAEALRSPIFGMSEDHLFRLAHGRPGSLWQALRGAGGPAYEIVSDLLNSADFLRPYELLERILTRHDGRRRLLARLGAEAEDGIDALLSQALAYEQTDVPSLTGFLTWLRTGDVTIKRQLDSAGNRIRVMTVHGAKGLEAPIVILPDTAKRKPPSGQALCPLPDGHVAWAMPADENPPAIADARATQAAAQEEERARLLYVAMTRAECWLIVAAAGEVGDGVCWYDRIGAAMSHAGAAPHVFHFGKGARLSHAEWPQTAPEAPDEGAPARALPGWAGSAAPQADQSDAPLTPTGLGGAKALPGEGAALSEEAALRRGRQLHRLLEHLPNWPRADWQGIAIDLLADGEDAEPDTAACAALLSEASAVLDAPELAAVFGPGALTEVEITADLFGKRLVGTIDRLLIDDGRVLAIDYKSNVVIPRQAEDVPEGLLRQMAAYRAALAQVFPGHRIDVALLWTGAPALMPLPPALLEAALDRAGRALA
jgi:ATP-dependent helicase/nuclease subunit A